MRRFFIEEIIAKDGTCIIEGSEARHITKVLRMGQGDRLILMDSQGARFQAIIESAYPHKVSVTLERPLPAPPPSPANITLCQALLKSRPMDYVVQKTSELGVNCIIPFSSERTVVRIDSDRISNKVKHWQEIAHNAAKQSDRGNPLRIGPPYLFQDLLEALRQKDALKIILWEDEKAQDLKTLLRSPKPRKDFIGMIGPEGGFSHKEIEMAREAGFSSVSLGERILRAETAAITLIAIVQYEWGDLGP